MFAPCALVVVSAYADNGTNKNLSPRRLQEACTFPPSSSRTRLDQLRGFFARRCLSESATCAAPAAAITYAPPCRNGHAPRAEPAPRRTLAARGVPAAHARAVTAASILLAAASPRPNAGYGGSPHRLAVLRRAQRERSAFAIDPWRAPRSVLGNPPHGRSAPACREHRQGRPAAAVLFRGSRAHRP
jgi:hypothetical protein